MDHQMLNDTIFFTLIGISLYGLVALFSTYRYLHTELLEWDRGLTYLMVFLASSIVINLSFREQVGHSAFFTAGRQGDTPVDSGFTWAYVLSLCTNACLILALKHIRPDLSSLTGRLLSRINWNWVAGVYIAFSAILFTLTSQILPDTRSFIDAWVSSASVLLFCGCAAVILWDRRGKWYAFLIVAAGAMLALAQGFLFGKIYPGSHWAGWLPGVSLRPQSGVAIYIIGRTGLIISILNLSQTWLKIRLEERASANTDTIGKNELQFRLHNNELTILLKMKGWDDFADVSAIQSNATRRDIVEIAHATKRRSPIPHQTSVNYSRMRSNILKAINSQLSPDRQLTDADLFGNRIKETIFRFDPDGIDLPDEVADFFLQ